MILSRKDVEGVGVVEGSLMGMHLYCWSERMDVTLSHMLAVCQAPGISIRVGLEDMMEERKEMITGEM